MGRQMKTALWLIISVVFSSVFVQAGEADVTAVTITKNSTENRVYSFDVTVSHGDEGWKHYANSWDIVGPDGVILATRVLYHPHVNEQPFTRSLSGVKIPEGIGTVTIRAHDLVHGYGGKVVSSQLPE